MADPRSPEHPDSIPGEHGTGSASSVRDPAAFIQRWEKSGAAERANYQLFLSELCDVLGVERPEPTGLDDADNAYVFERRVTFHHSDDSHTTGRMDLYKRGSFVLEAKQGVDQGDEQPAPARRGHGLRDTPAWDDAMVRARGQAEQYLRALPADEPTPPFLVVVDVGYSIELFADFTRSGRTFLPFPDARTHRIRLTQITEPAIRERLRQVWEDPDALDPARRSARVTRDIAERLATLARQLEGEGHTPDDVAHFLMRCLFTMFAEDVGLLPERSFTGLLEDLKHDPDHVAPMLQSLWHTMNVGGFSAALRQDVRRFNGGLFASVHAIPVTADQLELLLEAARADWQDVEPAIFGTLLERALSPDERHRLGAHFTPRAYVERLVLPTVVEPLREEWQGVYTAAATLARDGKADKAQDQVRAFLDRLCSVRVLDPACGTGNFLYVTLEHLKRLEGEVVDALEGFGDTQGRLDLAGQTVDPHQFLGIEINPRAAAIADLVLWIGYLQWHLRNRSTAPPEPILRAFHTIESRDALIEWDRIEQAVDDHGQPVTQWDGKTTKKHPVTGRDVPDESAQIPVWHYVNPRPAQWPEADFVVGNPPFIGPAQMRGALGDGYTEAVREVHADVGASADFVMFWWNLAATLAREGRIRRFGFVTTNSLRQKFNRRVIEKHLSAKPPLSLVFAIPDHPWVDSTDGAAVRIAMTCGAGGTNLGRLATVISETQTVGEEFAVILRERIGPIQASVSIGAAVSEARGLQSNREISNTGVKLHGAGFIVTPDEAKNLGLGSVPGVENHIKPYRNGRDITSACRGVMVIDLDGLDLESVQTRFPEVCQRLIETVKPERDQNREKYRRENWWLFGRKNTELRAALRGVARYITTPETAKHRFFVFLEQSILPDNMLVNIAIQESRFLGVLSSRVHVGWALRTGGRLGMGNDPRYNKTRCFETFAFPAPRSECQGVIRDLAEQLDAHRKRQQAAHPGLTLTGMYNVLEKLRTGEALTDRERETHEQGLVSVLGEIHDRLDEAVLEAYGWSDLAPALVGKPGGTTPNPNIEPEQAEAEEELLARLVALNAERAEEERRGLVRWLRPEYQAPDEQPEARQDELFEEDRPAAKPTKAATKKPWPKDLAAQANAVRDALADANQPLSAKEVAKTFKGARATTVAQILETLTALGHAREDGSGRFAT
jgi:SAM-dependent methyltransferase